MFWLGKLVLQISLIALKIPIIPTVEYSAGNAEFGQCQASPQMRSFNQSHDLQLLRCSYLIRDCPNPLYVF